MDEAGHPIAHRAHRSVGHDHIEPRRVRATKIMAGGNTIAHTVAIRGTFGNPRIGERFPAIAGHRGSSSPDRADITEVGTRLVELGLHRLLAHQIGLAEPVDDVLRTGAATVDPDAILDGQPFRKDARVATDAHRIVGPTGGRAQLRRQVTFERIGKGRTTRGAN